MHAWLQLLKEKNKSNGQAILFSIFGIALLIRLILAITTTGYKNDLALFRYWSEQLFSHGLSAIYTLDIFVDYPPGYMYILYLLGILFQLIPSEANSIAYLLILKLPIIIFDLLTAIIVYRLAKAHMHDLLAKGLLALFLFNPWTLVNGVVWGQVDSVFAFFLALSFYYLTKQKTVKASIVFAIAALIKPQAFIFMPVIFIYLVYQKQIKAWLISAVTGFSTFLLLALPFFPRADGLSQLISLYRNTLASYPYASLNTFNSYSLFGYNWASLSTRILTLPIELISYLAIALTVIMVVYYSIRMQKKESYYFYLASITIASVYLFVAKMHERYIFPILICLLLAYIYEKNKHYLYILLGYSVTTTINLIAVLNIQQTTYTIEYDFILISCSTINIILFIYLLWVGYKNFIPTKTVHKQDIAHANDVLHERSGEQPVLTSSQSQVIKGRLDKLKLFAVVLLYSVVAFYHLGSSEAPETVWKPTEQAEYVIFDFGEVTSIDRAVIFSGTSHIGSYTLSSYHNDTWQELQTIENAHTYALSNEVWELNVETQYLMLHAVTPGFILHEIAFFNAGNKDMPLPVTINLTDSKEDVYSSAHHLIDEQGLMRYNPEYLHGSYFDEIYHARTAYEYINQHSIYETTHPPLGKLFIAIGLQLFGFSPFGWRVIGTVVGIIVLLVLYKLAKLLFKNNSYALAATILFAVDFMHFTQSRIATIDIYSICFTMLMFLCMTYYSQLNFFNVKLWKTLIPLALSGLFFGLGIATKWNGFYGGAGLAIMLLLVLISRYRESKALMKLQRQTEPTQKQGGEYQLLTSPVAPSSYWSAVVATLLACCLFFVLIPAIIYYLVFQISFKLSGEPLGLSSFIDAQKYMYSYHADLVATHPFASPWYEWQIMLKPIWYYVNNSFEQMELTSTIAAFGNPLIWWFSIGTMLLTVVWSITKRHVGVAVIYIAFLSQLLPWVFVDRITFIYHFFGMVPFIILSIVYVLQQLEQRYKWGLSLRWIAVTAALCLFILFYPVLSGEQIERTYVDQVLRWFNSWYF